MSDVDLSLTIAPKSDQLNTDDLIAGPMTVRIAKVAANESSAEQPISIFFDGDGGKPYKPCKSMRRVMVHVWGKFASEYVGRSMTLYRDPKVTWGGFATGGIRISHMSHMTDTVVIALTETRKARKPYTISPLATEPKRTVNSWLDELEIECGTVGDSETADRILQRDDVKRARDTLKGAAAVRLAKILGTIAHTTGAPNDETKETV